MRFSRRRSWAARLAWLPGLAVLALLATSGGAGAQGREASLRGAEMGGYGRIALQFDQATKVSARVTNGVLVIAFAAPVALRGERLAAELPSYVSIVRR